MSQPDQNDPGNKGPKPMDVRGGSYEVKGADAGFRRSHTLAPGLFTSASFFAQESQRIEDAHSSLDTVTEDDKRRHRAFVLGAVTSSALAMEAYINQFYVDASEGGSPMLPEKRRSDATLLAFWKILEEVRERTLIKYDAAICHCTGEPYDTSAQPYQDAKLLARLRNAIVHYKPEWDTDEKGTHAKLEQSLRGKFKECPFYASNDPWFPSRCLSASCAEWAVATVEHLIGDFRQRIGYKREVNRYAAPSS